MELTIKDIKELVQLIVDNKLDRLNFQGVEITKSKHDVQSIKEPKSSANNQALLDEDEILFYSTSSPSLTMKEIEELAANPPPRKQRIKKVKE